MECFFGVKLQSKVYNISLNGKRFPLNFPKYFILTILQNTYDHRLTEVIHCVKYPNFSLFPAAKILWKGTVPVEFRAETLRKLCLSTKFPHQEIT